MGSMGLKSPKILNLLLLTCFVNFALSVTENINECVYRSKMAATRDCFSDFGVTLMGQNTKSGTAFVYSDLEMFHKLLQLLYIGSDSLRNSIQSYLHIRGRNCFELSCDSFNNILEGLKGSMGYNFRYENILYRQKSMMIQKSFDKCGEVRELDFKSNQTGTLSQINSEYKKFFENGNIVCSKKLLATGNEFFLFNVLNLKPSILGRTLSYGHISRFEDLDGTSQEMNWVATEGQFWTVNTKMLPISSNLSLDCKMQVFRSEINNGRQYMLYFRPDFTKITDLAEKVKCIQEIFFNLRMYVNRAIEKHFKPVGTTPKIFSTLFVPVMNINTEFNFKYYLYKPIPAIYEDDSITRLFNKAVWPKDLKMCDYFTNKEKNWATSKNPPTENIGALESPFVFTLVDKETGIFLKTGAFLRPDEV